MKKTSKQVQPAELDAQIERFPCSWRASSLANPRVPIPMLALVQLL